MKLLFDKRDASCFDTLLSLSPSTCLVLHISAEVCGSEKPARNSVAGRKQKKTHTESKEERLPSEERLSCSDLGSGTVLWLLLDLPEHQGSFFFWVPFWICGPSPTQHPNYYCGIKIACLSSMSPEMTGASSGVRRVILPSMLRSVSEVISLSTLTWVLVGKKTT